MQKRRMRGCLSVAVAGEWALMAWMQCKRACTF